MAAFNWLQRWRPSYRSRYLYTVHWFGPLSFTNISGGAARHEKVSPKTWRILAFADAIWFLSLQVFTTDQPRSRTFKRTFAPLVFAKKFYGLVVFGEKIKDKIGFFPWWTQVFVKIMGKCFF